MTGYTGVGEMFVYDRMCKCKRNSCIYDRIYRCGEMVVYMTGCTGVG